MNATLHLKSEEKEQAFPCGAITTLGRDIKNNIVLNDAKVSRSHAAIRSMGDGRYYLMDMGSANGTVVNGERVVIPRPLDDLDEIGIGKQTFIFRQETEEEQPEDERKQLVIEQTLLTAGVSIRQITTLVTDIRGYTSLSENMPSSDVARLLTRWCQAASEIVEQNGGVVDKFIGDAVMARWIVQRSKVRESVMAALTASEDLGREAEVVNAEFTNLPEPFRIGVGVNIGHAVMGTVGGGARREYTALGDSVNMAFRFETASKELKKDVVMGPDCHKFLPSDVLTGHLYPIMVKGKEQSINVCALTFAEVGAWRSHM